MENRSCGHEKYKTISEVDKIKISQCQDCDFIFTARENYSDSRTVYDSYYREKTGERFNFGIEYIVRAFRFSRALRIKFAAPGAKNILDIGSGRGWTLYYLKKYFGCKTAIGTQISIPAYQFSRGKLKLEIYNQDLLDINFSDKFDVIGLWHVLEHVPNPEAYVEKIYKLLNNKGILIIEVPNYNSWARKLTQSYWLAWDLKHHLTFFTAPSLSRLLGKYNFKIKKIRTFSLEYSAFTSAQSLTNWLTNSHDYFFKFLQGGSFDPRIILHITLFIFLFPVCFLINLILFFSKSGEVINITAQKK
jgi:SAM-dependent methyltransferase